MAYNNIGNLENLINNWEDQSIAGNKKFSQTVTAEAFYDSSVGSRILPPAIISINNNGEGCIVVSDGANSAICDAGLTFTNDCLSAPAFAGSGENIIKLQINNLDGQIPATKLNLGNAFKDNSTTVELKTQNGLEITTDGIALIANPLGGISVTQEMGISIDVNSVPHKRFISSNDTILLSDSNDEMAAKNTSFAALTKYWQNVLRFTAPTGTNTQLQFNNRGKFGSSAKLKFDNNTLSTVHMSLAGDLKIGKASINNNNAVLPVGTPGVSDKCLSNQTFAFNLDEKADKLTVKVKYSDGTIKIGSIDLL